MASTTSASPWAHYARTYGTQRPAATRPGARRQAGTDGQRAVRIAALLHILVLAILAPTFARADGAAIIVASGLFLALAAVAYAGLASRETRDSDAGTSAIASPNEMPQPPAAAEPCLQDRRENAVSASDAASTVPRDMSHPAPRSEDWSPPKHNEWACLMARVSHELRTPLNAVLGFSDVMDRGLFGPLGHARYEEYVRHIHDSGRELLKSAEDTLTVTSLLARTDAARPRETLDLNSLLREAWSFFGRRPQQRAIELDLEIDPSAEIVGERRTIRQALVNLFSEALSRADEGTAILVRARAGAHAVELSILSRSAPGAVSREPNSLHVCLARKLLEVEGAPFAEMVSDRGLWTAATRLERASQADFFGGGFEPTEARPH